MRVAASLLASLPGPVAIHEQRATLPPLEARHTVRPMTSMVRAAPCASLTPTMRPTFSPPSEAATLESASLRMAPLPCLLGTRDVLARVEGAATGADDDETTALVASLVDGTLTARTIAILAGLDEPTVHRALGRLIARGAVRVLPAEEEAAESGVWPARPCAAPAMALPTVATPPREYWGGALRLRRTR